MNEQDFKTAIIESELFKNKPIFSQKILLKYRLVALYGYYMQAQKHGIKYLLGNPNILRSEYSLIDEIIKIKR